MTSVVVGFFFRIALTKLDILDTLSEIKVGIAYTVDGKPLPSFPGETFLATNSKHFFVVILSKMNEF